MLKYIIIGIVAVIVLSIIMHFVNRAFRIKYNYNLFGGGIIMLLVIGCGVGAYLLMSSNKTLALGAIAIGAVLFIILFIVNVKKCGFGAGFGAIFLQIIFSVPSLLLIIELFNNKGYSPTYMGGGYRSRKRMEEERRRRINDRINNRNNY